MQGIAIIVVCNKRDFFLTRICIASIRYYYPGIEIFLLKDYLNGYFSSRELERAWNVKVLDLGIRNYGWSAAKMHILLAEELKGKRFLTLDSDIVFAGYFLEELAMESRDYDIAIDACYNDDPYSDFARTTYYDINFIETISPDFIFPGYFFNGGQMIVNGGILKHEEVVPFFDLHHFPYWKKNEALPFVDQSLLNYLLPYKEQKNEISLFKGQFMVWSEDPAFKDISLDLIKCGQKYKFLIHWAGSPRLPDPSNLTHSDALLFFENYYYSRIFKGWILKFLRKTTRVSDYSVRKLYRETFKRILYKGKSG